ncbi:MAG TPA: LCP family protein [Epulopiscium sp.]|nr:LCP family protein [Candidatus Epulonipiscium sp.]
MKPERRKLKKGAKKRLVRRFTTIMLSTFIAGTVAVIGGIAGYQQLTKDGNIFQGFPKLSLNKNEEDKDNKEEEEDKLKTNVAVFGVDIDGYRTDTMFVVHFDGERNSADLVSVPRDTQVRLSDTEYDNMLSFNRGSPRTMKLNEMTAYAGIKNVNEVTVKQIEKLLGIKIDNYVTVEIEAFRKIVDIIDGVDVDVPIRMKWRDSTQGLNIDLYPGMQHLNGAEAEGLVRFRLGENGAGYANGDTDRIKTQHLFLKAFAKKLLSKENIPNYPRMIPAIFKHVKTDINILDLPKYYGYASNFKVDAIGFHTIPGVGRYQGNVSYFFPDMDTLDEFVQEVFYKPASDQIISAEIVEDKSVKIEVLNGGAAAGTAGNIKEMIEKDGYNVVNVDNYKGENKRQTIIYAKDTQKAEQFKKYFSNCIVSLEDSLESKIDIQIVIGSDGI